MKILKCLLMIVTAPVILVLTLFVWLCTGLIYISGLVLGLFSTVIALLGVAVLITYSSKNGVILLVMAFLIVGRIDPVEYVGVSQQRNGDVRNINHPLCGCATLVIQKITFPL